MMIYHVEDFVPHDYGATLDLLAFDDDDEQATLTFFFEDIDKARKITNYFGYHIDPLTMDQINELLSEEDTDSDTH